MANFLQAHDPSHIIVCSSLPKPEYWCFPIVKDKVCVCSHKLELISDCHGMGETDGNGPSSYAGLE